MSAAPEGQIPILAAGSGSPDHLPCPASDPPGPEKLKSTIVARAALVGVAVIELADGTFLCTWRGWLKPCPNLAAVQHLVRQLTPGGAA